MANNDQPRWRWISRGNRAPLPPPREALAALDARIQPDFKRAVAGTVLAVVLLSVAVYDSGIHRHGNFRFVAIGAGVLFVLVAVSAVRSAAREVARIARVRASAAAGSGLYILVSVTGYVLVLLGILQIINIPLGSLLVGGAVTGVVLGIAAQQSLGNFFAGLVLLFSRPFVPGDRIKIFSGGLGGPFEGMITGSGLIYTTILTADGPVSLPNSGLLASAIGPAPQDEVAEDEAAEDEAAEDEAAEDEVAQRRVAERRAAHDGAVTAVEPD